MKGNNSLTIAREYFNAWTGKNFEKASDLLSEGLVLDVPINTYKSKIDFMDAVKFTAAAVSEVKLLAEFSNENEALLLYDMVINPIGNLRIAEYFKIKDGKISLIRHVHDTAVLMNAGFKR